MEAATRGDTTVGQIVGTIEYMAPEQARGEEVDQRADIYAFGLILYDMLLGRRRHTRATTAIAELRDRMAQAPPSPRSIEPAIPDAVDAIVTPLPGARSRPHGSRRPPNCWPHSTAWTPRASRCRRTSG